MKAKKLHSWDVTPEEATQIQNSLLPPATAAHLITENEIQTIAGCDVSYAKTENRLYASAVLLSYPELELLESAYSISTAEFPYIPGLLAFREGPPLLDALGQLETGADLVILDGHGVAHPRAFGIASHVGMLLDKPTMGVAKSILCGQYSEPAMTRGSCSPLMGQNKQIGKVVRTKSGVKPVFVSVGMKIALDEATRIVLACCSSYRLPEPLRQAHILSNKLRASDQALPTGSKKHL
jgi:deoxyribonuclease V